MIFTKFGKEITQINGKVENLPRDLLSYFHLIGEPVLIFDQDEMPLFDFSLRSDGGLPEIRAAIKAAPARGIEIEDLEECMRKAL